MLCDNFEKTEINDGDLVEMRFNLMLKMVCFGNQSV